MHHQIWRLCKPADLSLLIVAAAAVTFAVSGADKLGIEVTPRVDRPGNPDVSIHTGRLETTYTGQVDPFQQHLRVLNAFNARFELDSGQSQCFYCVLLAGHHYIQDAQTVRFIQESNFDIFVTDGHGQLKISDFQISIFRHQMVINDTDTYETCLVNRGQRKMISYSAYRVVPPDQLGESHQITKLHNFSETATASIGQLEVRMAIVLSYVRGHSEVYKDTAALVATNSSIQWKAWITLGLQLMSLVLTTAFIRHLFNVPVGKFAVST